MKHNRYIKVVAGVSSYLLLLTSYLFMTSCEGADLYKLNSPDWISEKVDSIAAEKAAAVVTLTPTPEVLGAEDNSQDWWSVFTDDVKLEQGKTYQIPLTNYGGASNWNNFVIILRNAAKDFEYAILRADNWGWGTGYSGEESDAHFDKSTEANRDWATWAKAMSRSTCMINIVPNNTTVDVKITMVGADGVTYTQNYLNVDNSIVPDDLYLSFTVDHSHVVFGTPVDLPDSNPASMELKGVPSEVLVGTPFEEAMANVSAEVTFDDGMTKTIALDELQIQVVPDFTTVGTKTLVVIYNKTYKGENCDKPLVATKTFDVVTTLSAFTETFVVPTPLILGKEDNTSTPWYATFTNKIMVSPQETKVISFTNYTAAVNNWDNFLIRLCKEDGSPYAVVRADNWGWEGGYAACTARFEDGRDWSAWLADMNGAKVTAYITNNGNGTADIKLIMAGTANTYTQEYIGINTIDPENMYFDVLVENSHVVFDNSVGAEDNSTLWSDNPVCTQNYKVVANQVATFNFTNYSNGVGNWNNFMIILNGQTLNQYAVLRADNWGWGIGYDACTRLFEEGRNWDAWKAAMNGAKVKVTVANKGDGTADVKAVMTGNDGNTYTQDYIGVNNINADDLYVRFSVDGSHLVFENN